MDYRYSLKKIKYFLMTAVLAIGLTGGIGSISVLGGTKKTKPVSIRTYVTYNKMKVGESVNLKVAPRKAGIKVAYSPKSAERPGISVKSSNSRIIKAVKVSKYHYKIYAVKNGSASLTITTLSAGASGKRLTSKIRLSVSDNKPISSITAENQGVTAIKLSFDKPIRDKFDRSRLKISKYDAATEKSIKDIGLSSFEYVKDSNYDILLKLSSELESNSSYKISYDGMITTLETGALGVAKIDILNRKLPRNKPTRLDIRAYDVQGNDVTGTGLFKTEQLEVKLISSTAKTTELSGRGTASSLIMQEAGSKAVIGLSYGSIKTDISVECDSNVDESLYSIYKSSISYGGLPVSWDNVSAGAMTILKEGTNDGSVAVLLKKSDGGFISNKINDIYYEPTASFSYSVEKSSKLKVDANGGLGSTKAGSYSVKIELTYNDNKYRYTLPIKVEAQKPGSLTLSPSNVEVSSNGGTATIVLKYKDTSGSYVEERDMKAAPVINYMNADRNSGNANSEPTALAGLVKVDGTKNLSLTVDGSGKPAGTYYYEVLIGDVKKDFVRSYLTVRVTDSSNDKTAWDYRFEKLSGGVTLDMYVDSGHTLAEIEALAEGISLDISAYNQFGTSIGTAGAFNYRINGKSLDVSQMPYLENRLGKWYFRPYKLETVNIGGKDYRVVKRLADIGSYAVTAEVYNARVRGNQSFNAVINVIDTGRAMVEGQDFKINRGTGSGTIMLQPGMNGTTSEVAAQLITRMDGSRFVPAVTAKGFDVRTPSTEAYYMYSGNNYVITSVAIPRTVITRDGYELYAYQNQSLNLSLSYVR